LEFVDVSELLVQAVTYLLLKLHVTCCLLQLNVSLVVENLFLQFFKTNGQVLDVARASMDLVDDYSLKVVVTHQVLGLFPSLMVSVLIDNIACLKDIRVLLEISVLSFDLALFSLQFSEREPGRREFYRLVLVF
jgi:hypothetical protein